MIDLRTLRVLRSLAVVAPVGVPVTGCTVNLGSGSPTAVSSGDATASAEQRNAIGTTTALVAAAATAERSVGSGRAVSVDFDENDGRYEVVVVAADLAEHEVGVNAAGDAVVTGPSAEPIARDDEAEARRHLSAKLDLVGAVDGITRGRGGTITDVNLDEYRGPVVWEGTVVSDPRTVQQVRIDADTAAVVSDTMSDDD